MKFVQVDFKIDQDFTEILIAELSENGYDSFWENEEGFMAYIEESLFSLDLLYVYRDKYPEAKIEFSYSGLESKNWNEEWEKNFSPIIIADQCYVRAPFHESKSDEFPLEVIIEPKMSFGTGHHATTSMMIEHLFQLDVKGKKMMDVGCGSAILSIVASKLGAEFILAFDLDDWAVENSIENIERNHVSNVEVVQGTIQEVAPQSMYDIILANITRNILLQELPMYVKYLNPKGVLVMSGFYQDDIVLLQTSAESLGLKFSKKETKEGGWSSLVFQS